MRFADVVRVIGGLILGYVLWSVAADIANEPMYGIPWQAPPAIGFLGFCAGLAFTEPLVVRPVRWLYEQAGKVPTQDLIAATIGLFVGLLLAALLALPLSTLPIVGDVLPFATTVVLAYLGVAISIARRDDVLATVPVVMGGRTAPVGRGDTRVILDTSAIIDGRIVDVGQAGFLPNRYLVPSCVLSELQRIADVAEPIRRGRGRRGLELLERLRRAGQVDVTDDNSAADVEVDAVLVRLARQLDLPIVTTDYNLNRVATIHGVRVLNVNELANAVKSVVLPGEELTIRIIQEGREPGQGVGFLDDGTMVIVEDGRSYLRTNVEVVVTRVLQTNAGRLVFAHVKAASLLARPA